MNYADSREARDKGIVVSPVYKENLDKNGKNTDEFLENTDEVLRERSFVPVDEFRRLGGFKAQQEDYPFAKFLEIVYNFISYTENGFTLKLFFHVKIPGDYVCRNSKYEIVPVSATSLGEILTTSSSLKGLKMFPSRNLARISSLEQRTYISIRILDVKILLFLLLKDIFGCKLYNRKLLDEVYQELEFSSATYVGHPSFDKNFLAFPDGLLDLRTFQFSASD